MSGYLDVVEEIVRCKNRLKSVFRSEVLRTDESRFYKNPKRVGELKNPSAKLVAFRPIQKVSRIPLMLGLRQGKIERQDFLLQKKSKYLWCHRIERDVDYYP